MSEAILLPVEGWLDRCASYGVTILRSLVVEIRDQGPLTPDQAMMVIRRQGFGADVAKASPTFDLHDGAERILNFFLSDVDVVTQQSDGSLYIAPESTTAHSAAKNLTITVETADMLETERNMAYRRIHLRRWIESKPFQTVWRDGIVKHSEEEVVAMADLISEFGYHTGFPITCDQFGTVLDGRLRLAALAKLDINPEPYMQTVAFANDVERLTWYLAGHCHNGKWPTTIRDAVVKMVNGAAKRSGIKMEWPQDIVMAVGRFSEPMLVVPESQPESKPVEHKPPKAKAKTPRKRKRKPPRTASKAALGLMMVLERGSVPVGELGFMEGSRAHAFNTYEQLQFLPGTELVILTETGLPDAVACWKRDRPERNVPDYDIEALLRTYEQHVGAH